MDWIQMLAICVMAMGIVATFGLAVGIYMMDKDYPPYTNGPTLEQYGKAYEEACCMDRKWTDADELALWIESRAREMDRNG